MALAQNVERPAVHSGGGARHPFKGGAGPEHRVDVGESELDPHDLGAWHRRDAGADIGEPGDLGVGGKARKHGPQALGQDNFLPHIVPAPEAAALTTGKAAAWLLTSGLKGSTQQR